MALLSVIRRWHHRDQLSIREIARRTGLSRNTIRKYLRAGTAEPQFKVPERPSRLDPFAERLALWLRREMARSRKQKRTVRQLHADLVSLGYDGSYNRVAAFARDWREDYRRQQHMSGRGTFVPLSFAPGEAFQFDSHGVLTVKSVFICACSFLPVTCFGMHGLSQTAEQANLLDRFKLTYGRRS